MKDTPLISIIIPTYNRAHLIGETLDSVLSQTYTNLECIVVDDGSTDNTAELLTEYCEKDVRLQYHHRPENRPKGANACRNYGFELSKGEYVNWFDSDDLMISEKLNLQVKELHNSTFDYTICQTIMIDGNTKDELGLRAPKLRSDNIFEDYILNKIFWLTGAPLWRKTFLNEAKLIFDEGLQQSQDYDFHIRVLAVSENYSIVEKSMVLFKHHEDNMSNSTTDSFDKMYSNLIVKIRVLNKYDYKLHQKGINYLYKNLLTNYKFHIQKNRQLAYLILKTLTLNINLTNKTKTKKIGFIFNLSLSYISFFLFSKGYKLLKFEY